MDSIITEIPEVTEYWAACNKLWLSGDNHPYGSEAYERSRIAHHDYHRAWLRLLAAGYTPNQAFELKVTLTPSEEVVDSVGG